MIMGLPNSSPVLAPSWMTRARCFCLCFSLLSFCLSGSVAAQENLLSGFDKRVCDEARVALAELAHAGHTITDAASPTQSHVNPDQRKQYDMAHMYVPLHALFVHACIGSRSTFIDANNETTTTTTTATAKMGLSVLLQSPAPLTPASRSNGAPASQHDSDNIGVRAVPIHSTLLPVFGRASNPDTAMDMTKQSQFSRRAVQDMKRRYFHGKQPGREEQRTRQPGEKLLLPSDTTRGRRGNFPPLSKHGQHLHDQTYAIDEDELQEHLDRERREAIYSTTSEAFALPHWQNDRVHRQQQHQQEEGVSYRSRRADDDDDGDGSSGRNLFLSVGCSLKELLDNSTACITTGITHFMLAVDAAILVDPGEQQAATARNETFYSPSDLLSVKPYFDAIVASQTIEHLRLTVNTFQWSDTIYEVLRITNWGNVSSVTISARLDGVMFSNSFSRFTAISSLRLDIAGGLVLEDDVFANLGSSLTVLALQQCGIRSLPLGVFRGLSNVSQLMLSNNLLTSLSPGVFQDLTRVTMLELSGNFLPHIAEGVFDTMRSLERLFLDTNRIASFDSHAFQGLHSLSRLYLDRNLIVSFPSQLFLGLTQLEELWLQRNNLVRLPARPFSALNSLVFLYLQFNNLHSLPHGVFTGLESLRRLWMQYNVLTEPQGSFFTGLPRLTQLYLHQNRMRTVPQDLCAHLPSLTALYLYRNEVRSLPASLLSNTPLLEQLLIFDNPLRSLPPTLFHGLSQLQRLIMSGIRLTSLPPALFRDLTNLRLLRLERNALTAIPGQLFSTLSALHDLDFGLNPHLQADSSILRGPSQSLEHLYLSYVKSFDFANDIVFPHVVTLSVEGVVIRQGGAQLQALFPRQLTHLALGWPGLNEDVIQFSSICNMLSRRTEVEVLSITETSYTSFEVCDGVSISTLFLPNNKKAVSVRAHHHAQIDLAGCSNLQHLDIIDTDILDISGTLVPFSRKFCNDVGSFILFAREMRHPSFVENAEALLRACFQDGEVFDFSDNTWFSNLALIRRVSPDRVVLADFPINTIAFADTLFYVRSRLTIPFLIVDGTPIDCHVIIEIEELVGAAPKPAFSFICECASGHRQEGDYCVSTALSASAIAGITLGMLALASLLGGVMFYRYRRKAKREKYQLIEESELKEQLLGERAQEVEALKRVWEINLTELEVLEKVDEGAFGEVWKGLWDGLTVAIKFMKFSSRDLNDPSLIEDFAKELEFLRRTRHPHLVRFFGTGLDFNECPFLVLEFVDLGSLRSLIFETGLSTALVEYHKRLRLESTGTAVAGENAIPSVDSLKLSLMLDVAKGMAFLHSLNVVHRDLKSGNVLVTNRLVAKITDFGSMSGKLDSLSKRIVAHGFDDDSSALAAETVQERKAGEDLGDASSDVVVEDPSYDAACAGRTLARTMTAGVGTPLYMAPEVLDNRSKLTVKIDVFSFGVLLWEVQMCQVPDLIAAELGDEYQGLTCSALRNLYDAGKRLQYPDGTCPRWYVDLTAACMESVPALRPTFAAIIQMPEWRPQLLGKHPLSAPESDAGLTLRPGGFAARLRDGTHVTSSSL